MEIGIIAWSSLIAVVVGLIIADLLGFGRGEHRVSMRAAVIATIVWTIIGIAPTLVLLPWLGRQQAGEYLTGYVVERTLSMDNLFVFAVIFTYFAVPQRLQPTILMWGIVGAMVLRLIFIVAGAALLDAAHWTIYIFGIILIVTAIRLARGGEEEVDPSKNIFLKMIRKRVPLTDTFRGTALFVRENGVLLATPALAVFAVIATTDVLFAVDSIPAIFAITREPFIVFAANAFALLGMRAFYFVLAGFMDRFEYLGHGLAILLGLIGVKMLLTDVYHPPLWATLVAIVVILGSSILYSLWRTRDDEPAT